MSELNRVGGGGTQQPVAPGPSREEKREAPRGSVTSIKGALADIAGKARPIAGAIRGAAAETATSIRQSSTWATASDRLRTMARDRLIAASDAGLIDRLGRVKDALAQAAEKAVVARAVGPNLKTLLGNINPLDAAIDDHQREQMLSAIKKLDLKAEIATLDDTGELRAADRGVFEQIYMENFPAAEAVPVETIRAAMANRRANGTELDGKRFTLCYTGKLPGETERRPLAFAQGGTLDAGEHGMVSFAEYLAVHDDFRGNGMLHVMLGFVNASAMAAVAKHNEATGENKAMLGAVWEIDPLGRGEDSKDRLYTIQRNRIYDHAGALVVMGETSDGQRVPVHAQPDVTPTGDTGNWHLHFVYRPNPGSPAFDKAALVAASQSYDGYFRDWAATAQPGVNETTIVDAAQYKAEQHAQFDHIVLMKPSEAPSDSDMARDDPLIAKIVAEEHGLTRADGQPYKEVDFADSAIRNVIADQAAAAFESEREAAAAAVQ